MLEMRLHPQKSISLQCHVVWDACFAFALKPLVFYGMQKQTDYKKSLFLVAFIAVFTIIPFLGLTEFNTKGEPREAVVALSMIQSSDYILPINNGDMIPYKPPFLHWCIAGVSILMGGVTEFTSRFPSAVSLILMVLWGHAFFARRRDGLRATLTSLLTLTAFEIHRAGMTTRVDMMLTFFVVGALYAYYRWAEKGMSGIPLLALLCMSGGFLTKGPIGIILPCLVVWTWSLLRQKGFFFITTRLFVHALCACILPTLWYLAAYREGGNAFLNLVLEENVGRMLGKMTYESHEHSLFYNFLTLLSGWLPWTLIPLIGLFYLPYKKIFTSVSRLFSNTDVKGRLCQRIKTIKDYDALNLFVLLSFILIFAFYCIPSSKRSTYLLPCYPFMAYILSGLLIRMTSSHPQILRVTVGILSTILATVITLFVTIGIGFLPATIFKGKHAEANADMITSLHGTSCNAPNIAILIFCVLITLISVWLLCGKSRRTDMRKVITLCFALVFGIYILLDAVILPPILKTKSSRPVAAFVMRTYPQGPIHTYSQDPQMRFYGTDFYTGDRLSLITTLPAECGILMICARDTATFIKSYPQYRLKLEHVTTKKCTEFKDHVCFYRFVKR